MLIQARREAVSRSFYDTPDGRMSVDLLGVTDFINVHLFFSAGTAHSYTDSILDRLKQSVMRLGVWCH